jgi:hypothetical protein
MVKICLNRTKSKALHEIKIEVRYANSHMRTASHTYDDGGASEI